MSHYQSLSTSAAFTKSQLTTPSPPAAGLSGFFHLAPRLAAPGPVRRIAALADDALAPELAGVAEDHRPVAAFGPIREERRVGSLARYFAKSWRMIFVFTSVQSSWSRASE
jgi:hypothetical protein